MISRDKINLLYDNAIREINNYQKEYDAVMVMLYRDGLKNKLLEAYSVSHTWPAVEISPSIYSIDAKRNILYVDDVFRLDNVNTKVRGPIPDLTEARSYSVNNILESDLKSKIKDLKWKKAKLKFIVSNLDLIRNGLINKSDEIIEESTKGIDEMLDDLEKISECKLDMSKL